METYIVILTENATNGRKLKTVATENQISENFEKQQFAGGFKRFEIDIYDESDRKMSYADCREQNKFFENVIYNKKRR